MPTFAIEFEFTAPVSVSEFINLLKGQQDEVLRRGDLT
jgi:hypothetical protein